MNESCPNLYLDFLKYEYSEIVTSLLATACGTKDTVLGDFVCEVLELIEASHAFFEDKDNLVKLQQLREKTYLLCNCNATK